MVRRGSIPTRHDENQNQRDRRPGRDCQPPDQKGHPTRQAVRADTRGSVARERAVGEWNVDSFHVQRREICRQTVDHQLMDLLGPIEILERMLAEIPQLNPRQLIVFEHRGGCPREQNLSAVGCRHDPGGSVNADPVVAVGRADRLAGVHPNPHPHSTPSGQS